MADREKIIRYYRGTEGAELVARLLDLAEIVARNRKFQLSEFLDPYGYTVAETVVASFNHIDLIADGGYQGAERQRVIFVHKDFLGKPDFSLEVIKAVWNDKFYSLSHRDVLGSVMGLGVKRELIGDILVKDDYAKIIVDKAMARFIEQNFTKIASASISVQFCSLEEIEPREEKCKEIKSTVASLRIDSIASSGFGSSRSKITDDIAADKLKLNWQLVKSGSKMVKEGDVLSMRGRGRIEVVQIFGTTKKGRISILLRRYI